MISEFQKIFFFFWIKSLMNHPKLKQKIGLTEMMTHMERITATVN